MQPLISIIVPCYNQENYLEETLKSVENQIYKNWECLIINDGSTDKTKEICEKWVSKDSRFIYFERKNEGVTKTRDFGIDHAKGDWIQFLDADDTISTNKLERSLDFAENSNIIITNFAMIFGDEIAPPFCDLTSSEINFQNLVSRWDIDFNLPIHCVLIKKDLLADTRFRSDFKANEDWIFWLEIFNKNTLKLKFINEKLAFYRHNIDGASKKKLAVYQDNFNVNNYLFDLYGEETKKLLYSRINRQNLTLKNTDFEQKKYIHQLQNTKILKYYISFKKLFS